MDRYLITVQAFVTLALMGFALFMYTVVGGPGADTIGSLIVGAVVTHWFKESSTIARKSAEEPKPEKDERGVAALEAALILLVIVAIVFMLDKVW